MRLDVCAMREAAAVLQGRHDFSALCDTHRAPGRGAVMRKRPKLVKTGGVLPERASSKNMRCVGMHALDCGASI